MRVPLNGYVVSDDDLAAYQFFNYTVFSPSTVRQAIQNTPVDEKLIFEINSGGGSVFAGFEIYSVLKSASIQTVAEVQSLAASAASTLMMGCERVLLSPVAQVMIHLPSTHTSGDKTAHQESVKILDAITKSIINGYEAKCKGKTSRAQLESMVNATTWMTAQEAVAAGFADGILYQDCADVLPSSVINSVAGGIRTIANSTSGLPDPSQLRAEYDKAKAILNANDWKAQATINIEKNRFS